MIFMMKRIFTILWLSAFLFQFSGAFAQQGKPGTTNPSIYDKLDTRVDNMRYWIKMAEKGLTPGNPRIPIPPAVFKGSQISDSGIKTTNSPDIPVTNLTNVTESENSVFVNPNNASYLLNSNNSTSWTGTTYGTLYGANYFQSANAGIGWVGTPTGAGGSNSGDPTTAIGLNGRQYVNYISSNSGQGIAYSDNGTTWATASVAPSPGSLADKNHMWIDNKITSPYEGNLYVAWTDFGGTDDTQIKITRSVNDGVSWSAPLNISGAINAGSHNQGVNIQTGPNGEVYAAWAVYDDFPTDETAIGFTKSTNGGVSYQTASRIITNIRGIRTTGVSKNHRVNSFPVMAVDISNGPNSGNIYIVWTNTGTPGINTGTNKSVYMARSTNGGTTWSTPIRVNQGPNVAGKEAYFPWITCDPETGVLSVVFYDDRNTTSTQCEVFVAYSVDAGNNWTDFQVSDVAFTPSAIPGLATGYMGDYLGITSRGGKVYPCWTDTRGGLFMTYVSPFEIGLNAGFSASSTTLCTGSGVTFTNFSAGSPTSFTWSFPGGTPSAFVGQNPPEIFYNTPGIYDVTLSVSDGTATDTETKTGYITVKDVFAAFTGIPTTVVVGNTVTFTDNSACNPTTWVWSFPGGTPSSYSGQTPPPITYNTLGSYDVSLVVTKSGSTDTKTITGYVNVVPPIFNITNGSVTTCTGNFYDTGGPLTEYLNNEVFVETFYPSTPDAMIRFAFTSFSTEPDYDTLTIYNGINSSAPIIGRYHGTTGPGTVTASNPYGALTFRFKSDVAVTDDGWAATISCITGIVSDPLAFAASAASTEQINLAWIKNFSNNDVMIAWSPSGTFGTPVNGTVYPAGGSIAGGGTVLYRGNLNAFSHSLLSPSTTYYYKIFAYNSSNNYSPGLTANATTLCGISPVPFTENFNTSILPSCWTTQISGSGGVNKWLVSPTGNAGGSANEMKSTWQSVNPGITRLVTPPMNTIGISQLNLSFKHLLDAYGTGCTLRIQSSTNGSTWTNEAWFISTTSSNVGPQTVNTTILNNLNSPATMIAFTIEGNLFQYDYWYIDNVSVTGGCSTYYPLTLSIQPSANPVEEGVPVTFTASAVNGGTAPAYQWKVNGANAGTNSDSFTYIPVDGDLVSCVVTSGSLCVSGNPATSNVVTMTVNGVPVINELQNIQITDYQCFDATQTIVVAGNGTTFTVMDGGSATLIAGQNILLYPGTVVLPGGYMLGYIAPAGPFCTAPTRPVTLAGIPDMASKNEQKFFTVYPNPTSGTFTLALKGYIPGETCHVEVYSMKGEKFISAVMKDQMNQEFSLAGRAAGIYLVRLISESGTGVARVIKMD
jgi:hypothetical protein